MGFLSSFRKPSADDPPPTESWPLFAFGKLPVYKDFISAGLTDDASREFRDWLSDGFSKVWSARDDCRSAEIPLHAFLLRLPQSRKVAAGALWGSSDQGGLRKFPFAIFTILPSGKPAASVLTALDYLPVFEARAREIRRKYEAGGALAAVYQELRGATIEVPVRKQDQIRARLAEALARPRVGPFARTLFESDTETRWASLLSGVDAAARRPLAGAAAFRLPLAAETSPNDQMKLWAVRLTKASPGAVPAGVLYRTGGDAPSGVVLFRDTRADDILLLHPAAIPTDFVEEIPPPVRAEAKPAADEPAAPEPVSPEPPAPEPVAAEPVTPEPAAATSAAPSEAVPPPPVPANPAAEAPPPPDAPPADPPLIEGMLRLGAAATIAETRPAVTPVESVLVAPPSAPAGPDVPAAADSPALEGPARAPTPAALSQPAPVPEAEPAGWELPLASLL